MVCHYVITLTTFTDALNLPLPLLPPYNVGLGTTISHNNNRWLTPICRPQQPTAPLSPPIQLSDSDSFGEWFVEGWKAPQVQ